MNKAYNGTKESLLPKSHRPLSPHPNAHTEEELKWIRDYHRRNLDISVCELYGKLREQKASCRHPGSLYRVFVRLGFRKSKYDTPKELGVKWQLDGKYVPTACHTAKEDEALSVPHKQHLDGCFGIKIAELHAACVRRSLRRSSPRLR